MRRSRGALPLTLLLIASGACATASAGGNTASAGPSSNSGGLADFELSDTDGSPV